MQHLRWDGRLICFKISVTRRLSNSFDQYWNQIFQISFHIHLTSGAVFEAGWQIDLVQDSVTNRVSNSFHRCWNQIFQIDFFKFCSRFISQGVQHLRRDCRLILLFLFSNRGHLTECPPVSNEETLPIPEELISYIGM